jgi:chitin synthase
VVVYGCTWWILPPFLSLCGKRDGASQYAFREKLTLCFIIVAMCTAVAFLTYGFPRIFCSLGPSDSMQILERDLRASVKGIIEFFLFLKHCFFFNF